MGEIPRQLAARVRGPIRLDTPVSRVDPHTGELLLGSGERLRAERTLIATDAQAQAALLGLQPAVAWNPTATLYYDADPQTLTRLARRGVLVLDGDGNGPVNHLAVPSDVCPSYAPPGRALVACNVIDPAALDSLASDEALDHAVRRQMLDWFGPGAQTWTRLGIYRIRHALPRRDAGLDPPVDPDAALYRIGPRLWQAGDHLTHGSIEGAVIAGTAAAEAMLSAS
jgi:hypothetical protein